MFGVIAVPTQSLYNASKFAVRGYTEALQQELEIEGSNVSAHVVLPGGVKTNIARAARISQDVVGRFLSDADRSKRRFEKMFRTEPTDAALQILRGVQRGHRRILVGNDAVMIDLVQRALPTRYQDVIRYSMRKMWKR